MAPAVVSVQVRMTGPPDGSMEVMIGAEISEPTRKSVNPSIAIPSS